MPSFRIFWAKREFAGKGEEGYEEVERQLFYTACELTDLYVYQTRRRILTVMLSPVPIWPIMAVWDWRPAIRKHDFQDFRKVTPTVFSFGRPPRYLWNHRQLWHLLTTFFTTVQWYSCWPNDRTPLVKTEEDKLDWAFPVRNHDSATWALIMRRR